MFLRCPRQWYFHSIVASHTSNSPLRREAHYLKQLQSVYAWRGSLVDRVIEKVIVPNIKNKNIPSTAELMSVSEDLIEKQMIFAKDNNFRSNSKTNAGDAYCALFDIEYNGNVNEDILSDAKNDIKIALRNLLHSSFLKELLEKGSYLAAQRHLIFKFENVNVSCTPDLLVFPEDEPPIITDWKVHSFPNYDYSRQLGLYAIALSRIKTHKDFPEKMENKLTEPTTFRLIEYQLLHNEQREYAISNEDVAEIEDYIFFSSSQMIDLVEGKKFRESNINEIPTTRFPQTCTKCQFQRLCWKKQPSQMSLFEVV